MNYKPSFAWERKSPTVKQVELLVKNGFNKEGITCKGAASAAINLIIQRSKSGLASPKQLKQLIRFNITDSENMTFSNASNCDPNLRRFHDT